METNILKVITNLIVSIGTGSHRLYYQIYTSVNKNTMRGKSKFYKTHQEAIHCIKGDIINRADSDSFPSPPVSPPRHTQYTRGTWANMVPIKCTDVEVGPRSAVVSRGGFLGKMIQSKEEIQACPCNYRPGSKPEKLDCSKSTGQVPGQKQKKGQESQEQEITDCGRKSEIWPREEPIIAIVNTHQA